MASRSRPKPAVEEPNRRLTVAERIAASESEIIPVTVVEVEAAKLRLITDRNEGKESPLWVQKLAAANDD